MKSVSELLTRLKRQQKTLAWLVFVVLVIAVIFIGLDNVPGIILGFLAPLLLGFMLTRGWRKIRSFLILFAVCLVGIMFLSFFHEFVFGLVMMSGEISAWQKPALDVFHMVISLVVAFACPVGMLIGLVGSLVLFVRGVRA